MQGIFISYRRQDSQSAAGRLADDLKEIIVDVPVFRDVETIAPGVDFVEAINRALQSCGVLLAVIGPRWLNAVDSAGQRRLNNPDDYTRLEIATALKRSDVRVIPVLVEGALMPAPSELPADLQALARRNAVELSDNRWNYDVSRLAATVCEALGVEQAMPQTRSRQRRWLVMAAVALAVVGMGYLGWRGQTSTPPEVDAPPTAVATPQPGATVPATAMSPIKNGLTPPTSPSPDASGRPLIPPNTAQADPCPTRFSINRSLPTPFSCRCGAASAQHGSVWGSDVYTDDSNLCLAAVHVGAIPAAGGTVTVTREAGRPLYTGSRRNGIESSDYGVYNDSIRFVGAPPPAPGPQPCPTRFSINRTLPTPFSCRCGAASAQHGSVWGSDVYTDDSNLCLAAMHVGAIPAAGGTVTVTREAGRPLYTGSLRNGVQSSDYGAYNDSIRFVGAPPPAPGPQPCPARFSINRTLPIPFSCRCGAASAQHGSVWGSDVYTDDSNLCLAAVHVGAIPAAGGTVTVTREPGRAIYPGSRRNGIESADYGVHSDSIRFVRRAVGGRLTLHPDSIQQRAPVLRPSPEHLRIQPR